MFTDDIINTKYISGVISRDVRKIHRTQEDVVRGNFPGPRGTALANFISSRHYVIQESGSVMVNARVRLLKYLRFLDIIYSGRSKASKYVRRRLALYNRVVWGVLYGETLPAIRYGLTQDIRRRIGESLQKSLK